MFLAFDLPFLAANALKFFDGGYLPFGVGVLFVAVMLNWRIGRGLLGQYFKERAEPLAQFVAALEGRIGGRCAGTAVLMASGDGVPPAMRRIVERFRTLHETVVLLTIVFEQVPRVEGQKRAEYSALERGFHRIKLHYGFIEELDVHGDLLRALSDAGVKVSGAELLYVLGRETVVPSSAGRMRGIWEGFFAFLSRNARNATDYFRLPREQVLEVGAQVDL